MGTGFSRIVPVVLVLFSALPADLWAGGRRTISATIADLTPLGIRMRGKPLYCPSRALSRKIAVGYISAHGGASVSFTFMRPSQKVMLARKSPLVRALSACSAIRNNSTYAGANGPVAYQQELETTEGIPLPLTINAVDPRELHLKYSIQTSTSSGVLLGAPPTLTYIPAEGFTGTDAFSFTAKNSLEQVSNTAFVTIKVKPKVIPVATPTAVPHAAHCVDYLSARDCRSNPDGIAETCAWSNQTLTCEPIPEYCPQTYVNERNQIVVDGKPHFVDSMMAFYYLIPERYDEAFNTMIYAADDFVNYVEDPLRAGKVKLLAQSGIRVVERNGNLSVEPRTMAEPLYAQARNVIGFESFIHEANQYATYENGSWAYSSIYGDVPEQSRVADLTNECKRLKLIIPSVDGTGAFMAAHREFADVEGVQAGYGTVTTGIRNVGQVVSNAIRNFGGKPVLGIIQLYGFQEGRERLTAASPSPLAIRNMAYAMINAGAQGIVQYCYAQSSSDRRPEEPAPSAFYLPDTPDLNSAVHALGMELKESSDLFLSTHPVGLVIDSPADINCALWDSPPSWGDTPGTVYATCTNVAEEESAYFDYVWGGDAPQLKMQLEDSSGSIHPGRECSDGMDNDRDGKVDSTNDNGCSDSSDDDESTSDSPYQIQQLPMVAYSNYVRSVTLPIPSFSSRTFSKVRVNLVEAAPGARIRFAIYLDSHRDMGAGTRIADSGWLDINFTGAGEYTFNLGGNVEIPPTQEAYIVMRMDKDGIGLFRNNRTGLRVVSSAWYSSFPPLIQPLSQNGISLTLRGGDFSNCEVQRTQHGPFVPCSTFSRGAIGDDFTEYAVHTYRLSNDSATGG